MTQLREAVPDHSRETGFNDSGSTIAKGLGVKRLGAGADQISLLGAVTEQGWGVTVEDIATGKRGGVQKAGTVIAKCSAAITAGARVECGTDGRFATRNTGTFVESIAL
jgi:hypothetical protein